jgi:hypothetical protein
MCQKLSDPYAMLKALEQKERRSKMTYLEKMLDKGYEYICCFCMQEFSDKPYYCGGCDEYKGIMQIEDYIGIYGDS